MKVTYRVHEGVRRLSIFVGIVASCVYSAWAGLSLVAESEMFQRDVWWLLMWWAGGLVICFVVFWGSVRMIAWVVNGFTKRDTMD